MSDTHSPDPSAPRSDAGDQPVTPAQPGSEPPARPAPDPTRYGDWEKNGRCIDF